MRRNLVLTLTFVLLAGGMLSAQVRSYRASSITGSNSIAYALPRTVVKVALIVEKESVRPGPYARFAQKYLGVMAPLADKDIYRIAGARISYGEEADPAQVYVLDNPDKSPMQLYQATPEGFVAAPMEGAGPAVAAYAPVRIGPEEGMSQAVSYVGCDTSFVKVPLDRREVTERTPEDMAYAAANTIYTLRKRRMELVTGEAGENVFGEGLKTALDEIDRLENEYLALFLGKQFRQRLVRTFDAVPETGKQNLIVCRFSETAGAVPVSDLSARPVILEMTPENKVQNTPVAAKPTKDSRGMVYYRIADIANCVLTDGQNRIATARIPIYQFGITVEIPVTSLK